jgi:3-oxoacyl-[acyl-carrier-protein] synthase II
MKRRVAVTGVGLVTPLGIGNKETWDAVCAGRSGVRRVTKFDPAEHKTQIAAEIHGFDPELFMNPKEARKTDAFIQYAVASAKLALDDSGLEITEELSPLTGTIIGSGIGGMETYVNTVHLLDEKGPGRLSPFFITNIINNMAAGYVSIFFNAKGPNCCTTTACAASAHAIGYATMAIRNGEADVMFAGGTEAPIIPLTFGGFNAMRALSTRTTLERLTPVRQGEGRFHHRRRLGNAYTRRAGIRQEKRRKDIRRDSRVRHEQRREPHNGAVSRRPGEVHAGALKHGNKPGRDRATPTTSTS